MKKVLLTGAAGYIGRHVLRELSHEGAEVLAVDLRQGEALPGVEWLCTNIFDEGFSLVDALAQTGVGTPDAVLHLAWRNGFDHKNPSHMADLSGHYGFLRQALGCGASQVAAMGTMHEVGYWEGAIDENTPTNPQSLYGIAKDALRRAFLYEASQTEVCAQWLRGFYIYGDDEKSQSIFGKILRAAARGDATFPFTSGKNLYDFVSVEELSRQIAACILQSEVSGVINCCSGDPVSLGEKIESFIADHGLSIRLDYGAYPDRPYDSPGVWGDASKIKTIMAAR